MGSPVDVLVLESLDDVMSFGTCDSVSLWIRLEDDLKFETISSFGMSDALVQDTE